MDNDTEELIRLKNAQMIITHLPLTEMNEDDYEALLKYINVQNEIPKRVKELIIEVHKLKNSNSENKIL